MKRLCSIWLLACALLLPRYAIAADPVLLPDWLIGRWAVAEIYEEDDATANYEVDPPFEPQRLYAKRILEVTPGQIRMSFPPAPTSLSLKSISDDELCTDFTAINEERGQRRQLVKDWMGGDILGRFHFPRRPELVSALLIACGNKANSRNMGGWLIVHPNDDTIEMSFVGHGYLVLKRVKPGA